MNEILTSPSKKSLTKLGTWFWKFDIILERGDRKSTANRSDTAISRRSWTTWSIQCPRRLAGRSAHRPVLRPELQTLPLSRPRLERLRWIATDMPNLFQISLCVCYSSCKLSSFFILGKIGFRSMYKHKSPLLTFVYDEVVFLQLSIPQTLKCLFFVSGASTNFKREFFLSCWLFYLDSIRSIMGQNALLLLSLFSCDP